MDCIGINLKNFANNYSVAKITCQMWLYFHIQCWTNVVSSQIWSAGNLGSYKNCRNCNHSIKLNSSPAFSTDRSSLRCLARMALNLISELLEKQMLFLTLFIWNKAKRPKILSEILQFSIKSMCPAYLNSILTLSEKEKWYKSCHSGGNLKKSY